MRLSDDPQPYHRGLWPDHSQHHCLQERSKEQPRQTVDNGREAGLCPPAPGDREEAPVTAASRIPLLAPFPIVFWAPLLVALAAGGLYALRLLSEHRK